MENILVYTKAITAVVAPLVVALALKLFNALGVDFTIEVSNAITLLLTGFFVWLLPNAQKK